MSPRLSDLVLSSQSDERLVALARAGHDRAFVAIVQRYRLPLYSFARRLDANGLADDLVQQTFLSAFAALRSGAEIRHLRGWLHHILRNAAIRAGKDACCTAELDDIKTASGSAQEQAELRIAAQEALAAIATLPDRQHQALVATAIHGRSRAEVASLLGLSEGAVRQLVHRARETLRAAATAITPYPVARALAATRTLGGSGQEAAVGAGVGAGSAVALKVGAVLASGVVAAGIVASGSHHASHRVAGRHPHAAGAIAVASSSLRARKTAAGSFSPALATGRGSPIDRRGGGSSGNGSGAGSRSGDHGSSGSDGGPQVTLATAASGGSGGSHDGGGGTISTSDGGGTATTSSGSGGTSGGGPGPSGGGQTTTSSGSDGGSSATTSLSTSGSGGSGSGDTVTTSGS